MTPQLKEETRQILTAAFGAGGPVGSVPDDLPLCESCGKQAAVMPPELYDGKNLCLSCAIKHLNENAKK